MSTFRLYFLGAGFSQPAGLPLAKDLFRLVRQVVTDRYGRDNHLERDLLRYFKYVQETTGETKTYETVNYEAFLGFLDFEHSLGLKGKDTWSAEGNESQLMVRAAIAAVLFDRSPTALPEVYLRFAESLTTTDCVFTFNYDVLLERALDQVGKPYRLFPDRFTSIGLVSNTVDNSVDEVVVLKLHGSIDWYDRTYFDERVEIAKGSGIGYDPKHPVFGKDRIVEPKRLLEGVIDPNDPLKHVYRVLDCAPLLDRGFWECCPLILAPSSSKILYAGPLKPFWRGMQRAGGLNLGLGIIGYSLPDYDDYARQALYEVARNYTEFESELELRHRRKGRLRLLNFCRSAKASELLKKRFRFLNWEKVAIWKDGLNCDAVDWLQDPDVASGDG